MTFETDSKRRINPSPAPSALRGLQSPVSDSAMIDKPEPGRFPPPWSAEGTDACFIVRELCCLPPRIAASVPNARRVVSCVLAITEGLISLRAYFQ